MKFYIHTLGCKVNNADSAELSAQLQAEGHQMVAAEAADTIYVAGCMVTNTAEKKSRKAVSHFQRLNSQADVKVIGCAAKDGTQTVKPVSEPVEDTDNKNGLPRSAYAPLAMTSGANSPAAAAPSMASKQQDTESSIDYASEIASCLYEEKEKVGSSRIRPLLKVQDGCNQHCAYCIVCKLRGPLWSLDVNTTVRKAKQYASSGANEIVICGINLGLHDDLIGLLQSLLSLTESDFTQLRFRLSSIEVNHVTSDLLQLMAHSNGKICRHLHIPLQSGCDTTLQAMGRPYTSAEYMTTISTARQLMPQIALTTDIIVGFPGETKVHFGKSLQFVADCGFSQLHVFPFSARPGTVAFDLPNAVAKSEIEARALAMRQLSERLVAADRASRLGTSEQIVIEKVEHGQWYGKTESYIEVRGSSKDDTIQVGDVVDYQFRAA